MIELVLLRFDGMTEEGAQMGGIPETPRKRSRWVVPLVILAVVVVAGLTLVAIGVLMALKSSTVQGIVKEAPVIAECETRLKTLGAALNRYEVSHGEYPPSLESLYPEYLDSRRPFQCPADHRKLSSGESSYSYTRPGKRVSDSAVISRCRRHVAGKGLPPFVILLRKDGSVSGVFEAPQGSR